MDLMWGVYLTLVPGCVLFLIAFIVFEMPEIRKRQQKKKNEQKKMILAEAGNFFQLSDQDMTMKQLDASIKVVDQKEMTESEGILFESASGDSNKG